MKFILWPILDNVNEVNQWSHFLLCRYCTLWFPNRVRKWDLINSSQTYGDASYELMYLKIHATSSCKQTPFAVANVALRHSLACVVACGDSSKQWHSLTSQSIFMVRVDTSGRERACTSMTSTMGRHIPSWQFVRKSETWRGKDTQVQIWVERVWWRCTSEWLMGVG